MSTKKNVELLRELWTPFFHSNATVRKGSFLNELAPPACLGEESPTVEALVACVQSKHQLRVCIKRSVEKIAADWLAFSPQTRLHLSQVASKHPRLLRRVSGMLPADLARLRMPFHIADALYADRRKQVFQQLKEAGLDLERRCFIGSRTHGIGDVELMLPDTLDTLLLEKIDIDLAGLLQRNLPFVCRLRQISKLAQCLKSRIGSKVFTLLGFRKA